MKKTDHLNDLELSYQELKGLELHFKQVKKDALTSILKKAPRVSFNLIGKMFEGTIHDEMIPKRHRERLQTVPKES